MSEDKRLEPLPTMATKEDLADAVKDEYGAEYSRDGLKLLHVPEDIERYEIKEGVLVICDYAFRECRSLREAVIPASVTSIGNGVFWMCRSLREAVIPASVTGIGHNAFNGCEALHVISRTPLFSAVDDCMLVDNVNHRLISSYNCKEHVAIPASVTSIGYNAFAGCESLREVVILASVTSIGEWAFLWCSSLSSVIVPRGQAGRFRELLRDSNLDLSAISIREQGCEPSNL